MKKLNKYKEKIRKLIWIRDQRIKSVETSKDADILVDNP